MARFECVEIELVGVTLPVEFCDPADFGTDDRTPWGIYAVIRIPASAWEPLRSFWIDRQPSEIVFRGPSGERRISMNGSPGVWALAPDGTRQMRAHFYKRAVQMSPNIVGMQLNEGKAMEVRFRKLTSLLIASGVISDAQGQELFAEDRGAELDVYLERLRFESLDGFDKMG